MVTVEVGPDVAAGPEAAQPDTADAISKPSSRWHMLVMKKGSRRVFS
jgi:hypothetical protein